MADELSEKTEEATPRKVQEALDRGQIAKSAEVQTVIILFCVLGALLFTGADMWNHLVQAVGGFLGHLHDVPVSESTLPALAITVFKIIGQTIWPVLLASVLGGLLAGGLQTRFRASPDALGFRWEKLNPIQGFKSKFSVKALVPTVLGIIKLALIIALSYGEIRTIVSDPIFFTPISAARIAEFMADSVFRIILRVAAIMVLIAALDYAYQLWKNRQDLRMTKQEVKDENKSSEGDPQLKARRKSMRQSVAKRRMMSEVPQADVVVTNPTHISIALRYDPDTMDAPKIVAKGIRLNALRIREIARQHKVPLLENKPLARMMFKYGKVGGEVPAQLYAAVAEVLAWVYRLNQYKYHSRKNRK